MPLDSNGLTVKRMAELRADVESALENEFGDQISFDSDSNFGRLRDVAAELLHDHYELLEQVYQSMDPQQAKGVALDFIMAWTGISRKDAIPSRGEVEISAPNGSTINEGYKFERDSTGDRVQTTETVTVSTGGSVRATAETVEDGAIPIPSSGTYEPVTTHPAVSGLSVPDDFALGRLRETDTEARLRRLESLQLPSQSISDGMTAALLDLEAVNDALVYNNRTSSTVTVGAANVSVPPHGFAPVVYPAPDPETESEIAQIVYTRIPQGINTGGANSFTVETIRGRELQFDYEVATVVDTEATVTIDVNTNDFPSTGSDLLKDKFVQFVQDLRIGEDIRRDRLHAIAATFPGVVDVTQFDIAELGGTLDADNIPISVTDLADLDEANILITTT